MGRLLYQWWSAGWSGKRHLFAKGSSLSVCGKAWLASDRNNPGAPCRLCGRISARHNLNVDMGEVKP